MTNWQKWMSALLLAPVLGYVLLCVGLYLWGAGALPANREPSHQIPSPLLRAQYFASEGITNAEGIRLDPLTMPLHLFRQQSDASKDIRLPISAGRILLRRSPPQRGNLRRMATDIAATIYVSHAWSVDEQIATVLDEQFYGRDAYGLSAAATAWYGLPPEALRPEESLALLVLPRAPLSLDPFCYPERFEQRFRFLSLRLRIADTDIALSRAHERLLPRSDACRRRSPTASSTQFPSFQSTA